MTFISGNIARAPNLLLSGVGISSIGRTNLSLFRTMTQLSTGRALNRASDDIVRAAAVLELDDRLERSEQTKKNLQFAESQINAVDEGLAEVMDILEQAKSIGLTQISEGASGEERRAQAVVIEGLISSLHGVMTRRGVAGYIFGGSTPGRAPVEDLLGAYRITTGSQGLMPDTPGLGQSPITVRSPEAVSGVPGVVLGKADLRPRLSADTRLDDLAGGRQLGVTTGTIEYSFDGGPAERVDLTGADTVGDVIDAIESSILRYEEAHGVQILGTGGIGISGTSIAIHSAGPLVFADVAGGVVAQDLGLVTPESAQFGPGRATGSALSPRLTATTRVSQLGAIADELGTIRIRNNARTADIDLSGAETIAEIKSLIESAGVGVRVRINESGTGIDLVNEIAGGSARALSVSEVSGNNGTAAALGIRTFSADTPVADLNFGRGVGIVSGHPDDTYNVDFTVTITNSGGASLEIEVDLSPGDMTTIGNVAEVINGQVKSQLADAGWPLSSLTVGVGQVENGLVLSQGTALGGAGSWTPPVISRRNNSLAAIHLGLTEGTWNGSTGRWVGSDKARVRVETAFTHLIDLKDALSADDDFGMELAVESLDAALDEVTRTRAQVGGFAQNVARQALRQEERDVLDEQVRSRLRDVNFAQAATEFSLLQTQLQAGLQTAAISSQLTLLNFL